MKRIKLKLFRVSKNLTQQQLADLMGVSVATYNLIENGTRPGSNAFWVKLQKQFNLEGGEVWNLQNEQI